MSLNEILRKYNVDIAEVEYPAAPKKRELPPKWPRVTLDQYSKDARRDVARSTDPIADAYEGARARLGLELSKCTYGEPTRAHCKRVREAAAELWNVVAPSERFDADTKAETGSSFAKARGEVKAYLQAVETVVTACEQTIDTKMRDFQRTVAIDVARRDGYPWYTAVLENPTLDDVAALKAANVGTPQERNRLLIKATQLQAARDRAQAFSFKEALDNALGDVAAGSHATEAARVEEIARERSQQVVQGETDRAARDAFVREGSDADPA